MDSHLGQLPAPPADMAPTASSSPAVSVSSSSVSPHHGHGSTTPHHGCLDSVSSASVFSSSLPSAPFPFVSQISSSRSAHAESALISDTGVSLSASPLQNDSYHARSVSLSPSRSASQLRRPQSAMALTARQSLLLCPSQPPKLGSPRAPRFTLSPKSISTTFVTPECATADASPTFDPLGFSFRETKSVQCPIRRGAVRHSRDSTILSKSILNSISNGNSSRGRTTTGSGHNRAWSQTGDHGPGAGDGDSEASFLYNVRSRSAGTMSIASWRYSSSSSNSSNNNAGHGNRLKSRKSMFVVSSSSGNLTTDQKDGIRNNSQTIARNADYHGKKEDEHLHTATRTDTATGTSSGPDFAAADQVTDEHRDADAANISRVSSVQRSADSLSAPTTPSPLLLCQLAPLSLSVSLGELQLALSSLAADGGASGKDEKTVNNAREWASVAEPEPSPGQNEMVGGACTADGPSFSSALASSASASASIEESSASLSLAEVIVRSRPTPSQHSTYCSSYDSSCLPSPSSSPSLLFPFDCVTSTAARSRPPADSAGPNVASGLIGASASQDAGPFALDDALESYMTSAASAKPDSCVSVVASSSASTSLPPASSSSTTATAATAADAETSWHRQSLSSYSSSVYSEDESPVDTYRYPQQKYEQQTQNLYQYQYQYQDRYQDQNQNQNAQGCNLNTPQQNMPSSLLQGNISSLNPDAYTPEPVFQQTTRPYSAAYLASSFFSRSPYSHAYADPHSHAQSHAHAHAHGSSHPQSRIYTHHAPYSSTLHLAPHDKSPSSYGPSPRFALSCERSSSLLSLPLPLSHTHLEDHRQSFVPFKTPPTSRNSTFQSRVPLGHSSFLNHDNTSSTTVLGAPGTSFGAVTGTCTGISTGMLATQAETQTQTQTQTQTYSWDHHLSKSPSFLPSQSSTQQRFSPGASSKALALPGFDRDYTLAHDYGHDYDHDSLNSLPSFAPRKTHQHTRGASKDSGCVVDGFSPLASPLGSRVTTPTFGPGALSSPRASASTLHLSTDAAPRTSSALADTCHGSDSDIASCPASPAFSFCAEELSVIALKDNENDNNDENEDRSTSPDISDTEPLPPRSLAQSTEYKPLPLREGIPPDLTHLSSKRRKMAPPNIVNPNRTSSIMKLHARNFSSTSTASTMISTGDPSVSPRYGAVGVTPSTYSGTTARSSFFASPQTDLQVLSVPSFKPRHSMPDPKHLSQPVETRVHSKSPLLNGSHPPAAAASRPFSNTSTSSLPSTLGLADSRSHVQSCPSSPRLVYKKTASTPIPAYQHSLRPWTPETLRSSSGSSGHALRRMALMDGPQVSFFDTDTDSDDAWSSGDDETETHERARTLSRLFGGGGGAKRKSLQASSLPPTGRMSVAEREREKIERVRHDKEWREQQRIKEKEQKARAKEEKRRSKDARSSSNNHNNNSASSSVDHAHEVKPPHEQTAAAAAAAEGDKDREKEKDKSSGGGFLQRTNEQVIGMLTQMRLSSGFLTKKQKEERRRKNLKKHIRVLHEAAA